MFDQVINRLEIANEYEWNAKRLFEAETKSPNWTYTYIQCLGDASHERTTARKLVTLALRDSTANTGTAQGREASRWPDEVLNMTLAQLLQLAVTAGSAPAGSRKMRQAAEQMSQVAALLQSNNAMAQLLWWSADVEPVPPGKPVIDVPEAQR